MGELPFGVGGTECQGLDEGGESTKWVIKNIIGGNEKLKSQDCAFGIFKRALFAAQGMTAMAHS